MNIKDIRMEDLEQEQIQRIINKALHRTYVEIEKFQDMSEDEVVEMASFETAYKTTLWHMMLSLADVGNELSQLQMLFQVETLKRLDDNREFFEDKEDEEILEVMSDIMDKSTKYKDLNNSPLAHILFEVSKDILSEFEFIDCL
ncbi:MAG: hypothetical protein ACI3T9_04495 [Romboutsia timonensis]